MSVIPAGPIPTRPPDRTDSLAGFIHARVQQNPEVRCIEVDEAGERSSRTVTELHRRALEILPVLRERVTAGKSDVVLCFSSALDFIPAAWACIFGGYSCLPWHLPKGHANDHDIRARLQAIAQRLDRPVLVTTDDIKRRVISEGSPFQTAISIDPHLLDQFAASSPADTPVPLNANSAVGAAFLVATSGTTAAAKIAIIRQPCLLDRCLALKETSSMSVRVVCFPFDGITGMRILYPGLADRIYLQPGRLAARPLYLLKLVEEFQVGGFSISPAVLANVLDAAEGNPQRHDLSSLQHVGLGAEMIVPNVVRRLGRRLREEGAAEAKVTFGYGMTETGLVCQTEGLSIDEIDRDLHANDLVSVGRCAAGWSLRIVDDAGRPLPPEMPGNIEVWSSSKLFSGYRDNPELNDQSFAPDGWFRTGDLGVVKDGALTITGRQKAIIIVNARKISLESIEAPLRRMEGIRRSLAAAAAVRRARSTTDELAVFFVPRDADRTDLDRLCREIFREIRQQSGLPVKHLVPVPEAEFPLTASGKIRRDELVRLYQSGLWAPYVLARPAATGASRRLTNTERWLANLWKKILKLEFMPVPEDGFFELGGDSLASAELIFAVEEKFSCELPVEIFFRRPTIATLAALVNQQATAAPSRPTTRPVNGGYRLLRRLHGFTGSWPGERLFADSLVVGLNRDGGRTPIFWICQHREEFLQLAEHLGPDQPLYGMRSCAGIIAVKDYSTEIIETVCNRYLWEMLSLSTKIPFFVGGNCQGGIFALALARRLKQIGRTPSLLILMEWMYSYGRYTDPVFLLYGDQSPTAEIYLTPEKGGPNWREDFPDRIVAPIPGAHREFFRSENIAGLAEAIRRHVGTSADAKPV